MKLLRDHPVGAAALVVFVLALGVRFGFWFELRGTALDRWHEWDQTDMATYLEQARLFAEEDWLAAEPHHPYHEWQKVAPPQKWLEWYGPHAFHQAPGYSYVLAAAGRVFADPLPWIKAVQLLLGAGTSVLVLCITARLAGLLAGCVAGGLTALYAPLFYLEPQVLREGPAVFVMLLVLHLLLVHLGERGSARRRLASGAGLGACLGVFAMFHEMSTVLSLVVIVSLVVRYGRTPRTAAAVLGVVAAGYLVAFSPLLARNVAVGASPLSVSCRTYINFVEANEAEAHAGGSTFVIPGPNVVRILDEADGSFVRSLGGVWATYDGDLGRVLSNWSKRFGIIWQEWEQADNTSLYFYREMTRTLRALPTFWLVFPLGLAGAVLVLAGGVRALRRRQPGDGVSEGVWRRCAGGHLVLLLYLAGVAGSLSLVHTVARFRLYLVPFFLIYAGVWVAVALENARRKRFAALAAAVVVCLIGWPLQQLAESPYRMASARPADYGTAMKIALEAGEVELATRAAERAAVTLPGDARYFHMLAWYLSDQGQYESSASYFRRALEMEPGSPQIQQGLRRALRRAGGE